jgi:large subunit ribosomal protein L17
MRHRNSKLNLGVPRGRRELLIGNLATSLILHEKIKTTETRAKALQQYFDKLMNSAKKGSKADVIRKLSAVLHSELSCKKMIEELVTRYPDKKAGYTRITRLGFRAGDAAPLVQIELV